MQHRSYLPSLEQEDLLKAALWEPSRALLHWHAFKAKVPFDDIDYGSSRLLPLVYKNLVAVAPDDPFMGRMKGIYRLTWAQNQRNLNQLTSVQKLFEENNIVLLLLKGGALTLSCYQDYGLRGMGDLDILIPPEKAELAISLLQSVGWKAQKHFNKIYIPIHHANAFTHNESGIEMDLHWHLIGQRCDKELGKLFWEHTPETKLGTTHCKTLQATDHLFHTLVHGTAWNTVAPIRWIADAYWLINHNEIDWDRLSKVSQKLQMVLPIRDTLHYLLERFEVKVPEKIISELKDYHCPPWQIKEYRAWNQQTRGFFGVLPLLWVRHSQANSTQSTLARSWGFIRYLKQWYGFDHSAQIPAHLIKKTIRKIKKNLQGRRFTTHSIGA